MHFIFEQSRDYDCHGCNSKTKNFGGLDFKGYALELISLSFSLSCPVIEMLNLSNKWSEGCCIPI